MMMKMMKKVHSEPWCSGSLIEVEEEETSLDVEPSLDVELLLDEDFFEESLTLEIMSDYSLDLKVYETSLVL